MKVGNKLSLVVFLGLSMVLGTVQAEVYKWVDERGKVHYSDRKMYSNASTMNISTGESTIGQSSAEIEERLHKQQKYLNYLTSERIDRKEKREKQKAEQAKQKKVCGKLQDQLKVYEEENVRWYELNEESGARDYISDDSLEARKQELRDQIKTSCS